MTTYGKPGGWRKAMLVATGVGVLSASLAAPLVEAAMLAPVAERAVLHLQDDGQAQPSQVGESNSDTEALDQGSPPAAASDDPESLDQGSPPVDTGAVPVPVTDGTVFTAAPVATGTTYSAPAGPQLPPGFGEGRVLVSNSSRGFPVGLEPCEVGVVSGRAYVGVKCGEDGSPVVGHSTFQNFPWVIDPGFPFQPGADVVTDPSFPFDENSPFFESFLDRTSDSDVVVLVAPRSFPFGDDVDEDADAVSTDAPSVTTGGVVSLAQPVRTSKEHNRERTRSNGSASSGDVSSDSGQSRTRRSASKKQQATVSSERNRGKNSGGKQGGQAKANHNKKKGHKGAGKESKKQRAKSEHRGKRNKDK